MTSLESPGCDFKDSNRLHEWRLTYRSQSDVPHRWEICAAGSQQVRMSLVMTFDWKVEAYTTSSWSDLIEASRVCFAADREMIYWLWQVLPDSKCLPPPLLHVYSSKWIMVHGQLHINLHTCLLLGSHAPLCDGKESAILAPSHTHQCSLWLNVSVSLITLASIMWVPRLWPHCITLALNLDWGTRAAQSSSMHKANSVSALKKS